TERNTRGQILWKYELNDPRSAQRLKNGNTFIVTGDRMLEVDRSGKQVLSIAGNVSAGRHLPDGRIVAFSWQVGQQIVQFDKSGKPTKTSSITCGGCGYNEILDNGHLLALSPGNGNVIEFDL